MDDRDNRAKGRAYEETARNHLISLGHEILECNYLRKTGEIDIISKDRDGTIVFSEVKYRKNAKKGQPYEAVTKTKQQKIYRTAEWYMKEHSLSRGIRFRFDVISILGSEITVIRNAFGGF